MRQWDGFSVIESDVRAVVGDPRWSSLPPIARAQTLAARVLVTPDGGRWLFGAHARWYRQDPADGQWHLAAPPLAPGVRGSAHILQATTAIVPHLVPAGPDFAADRGSTQGFVGPDVPEEISERVRDLLIAHRGRDVSRYPLAGDSFGGVFVAEVASTVGAVWGTLMWCAYAPAFDGNEQLLSMFGEFLARPLPGDEWVRWLPPASLTDLARLYGERVRARAPDAAQRLAALMADTAEAVRADARFRPRATALLGMLEPALRHPGLDHPPARQGDDPLRTAWLARCPPYLRHATLADAAPGEHFRHTMYDLVQSLAYLERRGGDPRRVAASLLAADVAALAPAGAARLYPWLDPESRQTFHVALTEPGDRLRRCWPVDGELAEALLPDDRATAAAVLGAAYANGLAWVRLAGVPAPPDGFVTAAALVRRLTEQRDDPAAP